MLQSLTIKNVALISSLSIDFDKGFNVLLGETGAGKSIIFDALNFVLGSKIDKSLLRTGESTMRVDALFADIKDSALSLLKDLGIEEDEIVLSRTYSQDGKSTIRINGMPTTQGILKEIGEILVSSYSQHESIDLLKNKNHIIMLDKYGGDKIKNLKDCLKDSYTKFKDIERKIKELGGSDFERERTKSLLDYQIKEIEDARLIAGEDEDIAERLKFLNNAEKIYQTITLCEELLSENSDACINNLQQASGLLSSITDINTIEECKERLDSARYEIEDICETLSSLKSEADFDENEFERLDRRHDLLKSLMKKYGGTIENVLKYLEDAKNKYDELENSAMIIEKLEKEKNQTYNEMKKLANDLTIERNKIADEITGRITKELRELGMKSASFEVKFDKLNDITADGQDSVEFIFSANKGQELKSLSKTASGGELSRFMLAVKSIFAEASTPQTLIFDEIDAGISGETGNIVGQKLYNITKYAQVLCITHLPQVASFGDNFYYVSKEETADTTTTSIKQLEGKDIIYDLARMIGGNNISEIAIEHAKEMRQKARGIV